MDEDIKKQWEQFLDPEKLRLNIIMASIYISSFEIMKNNIIDRLKDFYWAGFDGKKDILQTEYNSEVLSLNVSPLYASLQWLLQHDIIANNDMIIFENVKKMRNRLAHELIHMLADGLPDNFLDTFFEMITLLDKIEKWWVINVDIETDPVLMKKIGKINQDDVVGSTAMIKMLVDIALGTDEDAYYYINEFKKNFDQNNG